MLKILDGIYDDEQGGMHIDVGELLRANGYADTPENRDTLTRMAEEVIAQRYPNTKVMVE